jgi:GNAT superfamily N-acetyltransferase
VGAQAASSTNEVARTKDRTEASSRLEADSRSACSRCRGDLWNGSSMNEGEGVPRQVIELTTAREWRRAYPVMQELRPELSEKEYLEYLGLMAADGYRLFALLANDDIKALAGIALRTNFYYRRYVYVYDLVTVGPERSRGHGEHLLRHIEHLGRSEGCHVIALSSGARRLDAHRFYETKMGYDRASYIFRKELRS